MKIGLIYLPHPYLNQPDAQAPIGLMYLGAVLDRAEIECELYSLSSFLTHEAIAAIDECDIFGISVTSFELPQANRFAYLLKEVYPRAKVILGGPGTYSDEFVDWGVVDSICKGDAELTIIEMVADAQANRLKPIYMGKPPEDLDSLPFPARNRLKTAQGGNIFAYNKNYKGTESTIIISSRGCPFKCSFCSSPFFTQYSKGVRFRSPQNIYDEIAGVQKEFGIHQFRFSDDMFTAKKSRVLEICEKIGPLDIAWRISARVKPFDYEIAKAMHDAGCKEVSFGVESFDDHVLSVLKKGTTARDNARSIEIAKEVGMNVRVLFMIKTPGQRRETVPINIEWLEKVPYDILACTTFVPIPGSDVWHNPDDYGVEILDKNLDHYNFYFFGSHGENKLWNTIRLKGRDEDEVNEETQRFRNYLQEVGKVNKG